ncbi:MAG: hypothetical protein NTX82_06350 [Candidatus Parcubacteria bacterium]|nr:hypothetical protein [Candidatus Parcubacteria bacterium]
MTFYRTGFDPLSGNLTFAPDRLSNPFEISAKPITPWVENNTGPLLPAYKKPDEINFMKPHAHLSRAGNPDLLGVDIRPIVPLPRPPEITYIAPKPVVPLVSPEMLELGIRLNRQLEEQSKLAAKLNLEPEPVLWTKKLKDGSTLRGIVGGETHVHDYNDLGIGHVKIQSSGQKYPINNFNETVESKLPDWMLRGDNTSSETEEPPDESDCFL